MGEVIDVDVSSPECDANIVSRRVHVIVLTQHMSDAEIKRRKYRGQNNFPVDFVTDLQVFGGDYMREDVAATIVLGDFGLEGKSLPPKCLFVAWHGMLANEERDLTKKQKMAEDIYSAVRSLSGKGGYELRRFGGSSGLTDNVTDKNMLHALAVSTGILPRKSWGILLVRSTTKYYLVYRKVAPSSGRYGICHAVYSPPRDGGQFSMPDICILRYPVLAEMTYQKMMALQLMCAYNNFRLGSGMKPVAQGALEKELSNLHLARCSYDNAVGKSKMFCFLSAFNKMNGYSMVAHPVGMHYDRFCEDKESVENKIMFAVKRNSGRNTVGRGGSITGEKYVFALLDW